MKSRVFISVQPNNIQHKKTKAFCAVVIVLTEDASMMNLYLIAETLLNKVDLALNLLCLCLEIIHFHTLNLSRHRIYEPVIIMVLSKLKLFMIIV